MCKLGSQLQEAVIETGLSFWTVFNYSDIYKAVKFESVVPGHSFIGLSVFISNLVTFYIHQCNEVRNPLSVVLPHTDSFLQRCWLDWFSNQEIIFSQEPHHIVKMSRDAFFNVFYFLLQSVLGLGLSWSLVVLSTQNSNNTALSP